MKEQADRMDYLYEIEEERKRADQESQRADQESQRADAAEAMIAKYKAKYGDLTE
ncbi:MAG: hypothetical protein K5985_10370 [Lachnospiraceae bacterium]|nr:hypothetical protein [Lachnospiraceae bacterium]